ncbi:MAG: hypothetical protein R6V57_05570 [Vicinamibacterales bacterium]
MTIRPAHLTLALAALAAAVLYNVWYFVLRPGAPAAPRQAAEEPLVGAAAAVRPGPIPLDPLTIPAPPPIDPASAPSWRRDPFLFGDETRAVSRPVVSAQAAEPPSVRSILYSASRRLAIVNGRIVGIGDRVGDYTVAGIERDTVVFLAPSGGRLRVSVHATAPEAVPR